MKRCKHYICQCRRAAELAAMNDPVRAIRIHQENLLVECRLEDDHAAAEKAVREVPLEKRR